MTLDDAVLVAINNEVSLALSYTTNQIISNETRHAIDKSTFRLMEQSLQAVIFNTVNSVTEHPMCLNISKALK